MTADTLSLTGKVAIVTGSGRENGIGAGIAIALARNGASVTINHVSDTSASRAQVVAKKIESAGGKATVIQANLDTAEGAKKLVEGTLKAFGSDHIDILVNNAVYAYWGSSLTTPVEELEKIFRTNITAPIILLQAAISYIPRGGRIINISSVASKLGLGFLPAYGASKAALDSLTHSWALELGKSHGITVNTVAPGPVETDVFAGLGEDAEASVAPLLDLTRAERRLGRVEDLGDAVLLLVQEKSRWITGQFIGVNGGITGN